MSQPHADTGKVQALHRLHVLVAARDRRFQRMAGFLLLRAGFELSVLRKAGDVLATIERERPDVVILDGTRSLSEAARTAAVIEALHPHTTVVLVAEDDHFSEVTNLRVHPKWDSFHMLVQGLERAHLGLPEVQAEPR
jgi:DNA-binding NtrC family response regulator